jgi:MFS family permease
VRHPTLRGVVFTLWMTNIPWGVLSVALPVLVLQQFHWGAGGVGVLWSIAGVATIVAGVVVGRISSEGRERPLIFVGMVLSAASCLLIVVQSPAAVFVAMALFGLAGAPIDIGLFALRQRRTDARWFGRVFAVSMSLNFAGMPVGSALAGPVLERSVTLALLLAAAIAVAGCAVPFFAIPRDG